MQETNVNDEVTNNLLLIPKKIFSEHNTLEHNTSTSDTAKQMMSRTDTKFNIKSKNEL